MFGADLEHMWGAKRFYTYFFLCGVGAGLIDVIVRLMLDPHLRGFATIPTIGASGAIYGVLLAAAVVTPHRQVWIFPLPVTISMRLFVIVMGAIEFFMTIGATGDGVSHVCHLGGMLVGFIYLRRGTHLYNFRNYFSDWKLGLSAGSNDHEFVGNDPTNYTDPNGEELVGGLSTMRDAQKWLEQMGIKTNIVTVGPNRKILVPQDMSKVVAARNNPDFTKSPFRKRMLDALGNPDKNEILEWVPNMNGNYPDNPGTGGRGDYYISKTSLTDADRFGIAAFRNGVSQQDIDFLLGEVQNIPLTTVVPGVNHQQCKDWVDDFHKKYSEYLKTTGGRKVVGGIAKIEYVYWNVPFAARGETYTKTLIP